MNPVEGGCQRPDACRWNWWPDHCQCRDDKGKRRDAPDPNAKTEGERLAENIRDVAQKATMQEWFRDRLERLATEVAAIPASQPDTPAEEGS